MHKIALIVHACDRYQLLFEGFHHFFKENGGLNLPFKKYFFTEKLDIQLEGFENIKTGEGQWTDRLMKGLNQIEEEYILYFQEDMWLNMPLSVVFFEEICAFIVSNKIKLLKLHSSEVYHTEGVGVYFQGLQLAMVDKKKSGYLMSHQISIWDKIFLQKQLNPNEHPWRNERKATKRLRNTLENIYHIDYFAENNKPAINENKQSTVRSCYWAISGNARLTESSLSYIESLMTSESTKEYGVKLLFQYKNQVTHDGKIEPHKKDLFKSITSFFKKNKA
jgi:hypothetical protein